LAGITIESVTSSAESELHPANQWSPGVMMVNATSSALGEAACLAITTSGPRILTRRAPEVLVKWHDLDRAAVALGMSAR